ncbi:MAG: hypothetical protein IJJ44_00015 [Solobacterium sp.]|nr:hypothetical protein [Solobacterium sp.]
MTGDELIQYGFKRIIEELQKIQKQRKEELELLRKIEQNTFTLSGEILNTNKSISDIYAMNTITEIAVMEIQRKITKESRSDGGEGN